jgi:hypothetical protein
MVEVYHNSPDQIPLCSEMNPLVLHLAFVLADPEADKSALLAAGATLVEHEHLTDGSHLVMMRDLWGLAIQLYKRGKSMLQSKG